jgi:hypothetical protein
MQSIPRLFPLFLLTICIGYLFSALVPGLLESLIEPLDSLAADADNGIVYIICNYSTGGGLDKSAKTARVVL